MSNETLVEVMLQGVRADAWVGFRQLVSAVAMILADAATCWRKKNLSSNVE